MKMLIQKRVKGQEREGERLGRRREKTRRDKSKLTKNGREITGDRWKRNNW